MEAHDLGANDKPTSVWEKPSGDGGITKGGGTGPAMEVDHDPQVENLVACAATPRVNSPRSTGVRLKSMRSYDRTLIAVCCDAKGSETHWRHTSGGFLEDLHC